MALQQLGSIPAALSWLAQRDVRGLATDSRRLEPGDAFIAWPGHAQDGRRHVYPSLSAGAPACVVEADGAEAFGLDDTRIAAMDNLKAATGPLASAFFGAPSDRLSVIAVTGTNGKTSTAWWTAQALSALGRRCGVIGTLGVGAVPAAGEANDPAEVSALQSTGLTTPDPVTLQRAFKRFADEGYAACAIEASSIGLAEQRLSGTHIDVAVLTNFTQDHLDYHGSMDVYWRAKARLFGWPGLRVAVLNLDDPQGVALQATLVGNGLEVWTYGVTGAAASPSPARLTARSVRYADGGLAFDLVESGAPPVPLHTRLIGDYNVSNLLAVVAGLRALGYPLAEAAQACTKLTPVPGRMQRVALATPADAGRLPEVLVDYAHTPDALDKALRALQPLAAARGGALWCVFGCGGDRDVGKRPLMGAIAQRLAQQVVVTSDNPRHEAPGAIIAAIVGGMAEQPAMVVIDDRRAAIAHAVSHAGPNDVILIAGKGHEAHQEVAGVRHPFDDVKVAREAMCSAPSPLWGEGGGEGLRAATTQVREPSSQPSPRGRGSESYMATLADLHALLATSTLIGNPATPIFRIHSDTRTLRAGDLFVALRGERFDAHDFLPQAKAAGAVAALAERGLAAAGLPGVQVDDTRVSLGVLAAGWRRRFELPLIAVTGSNGKTTVTQMVAAILHAWQGDGAFSTEGNFNNDIGVPLTLLRLRQDDTAFHRIGVVELGMNHPGEIAQLAAMTAPRVALVNNAQREHQEFMAGVEAVARENGSVIEALGADGVAVFPADDAHTPLWRELSGARRTLTFALGADGAADVGAEAVWASDRWTVALKTPAGNATLTLRIAGLHNVKNALAATACALAVGCPLDAVVRGLEAFTAVQGRSQAGSFVRDERRVTLIDDSYNANPDSVRAAIEVLAGLPAPRWLVLGDMGEVGDQGTAFHREVGAYARRAGIEALWTAGPLCAHAAAAYGTARHFEAVEALLAALPEAPAAASVLVKGSRFMKMERVVAALTASTASATAGGSHAA